jgi:hypothetical protein
MASTTTPLAAWFEAQGAAFLEHEDGWRQVLRAAGAGAEYQAAREGLLLADGGDRAAILIQGADSLDFLQRLTSNDTGKLVPGAMLWSAMLDGKGHWVADLLLYRLPDADDAPQVLIDLPRECAEAVATRMEMSHFTEAVSWRTLEVPRLLLVGPQATGPGDGDAAVQGEAIWLRRPDRGAPCWECLAPAAELTQLADAMLAAGAVPGGLVALDILRRRGVAARVATQGLLRRPGGGRAHPHLWRGPAAAGAPALRAARRAAARRPPRAGGPRHRHRHILGVVAAARRGHRPRHRAPPGRGRGPSARRGPAA